MTPLPLALAASPEPQSSSDSGQAQVDRPERSRNAKAQARHRAKRKAYIEQLEQTVTKLQYALSLAPDQVAPLPPSTTRIRELEEENQQLLQRIEDLRTQLEDRNARLHVATAHRSAVLPTFDDRGSDHDTVKRRRTVEGSDDLSMSHQMSQQMSQSAMTPRHAPLQVTIPREYHSYSQQQNPTHHQPSPATPMINTPYGLQYQFPETPSPSVTDSPSAASFSSDAHYSPSMHAQPHPHHQNAQSPLSYPNALHPYARSAGQQQYGHIVKIEEDAYPTTPHGMSQTNMNGYASALPSYGGSNPALGNWHGYRDGA